MVFLTKYNDGYVTAHQVHSSDGYSCEKQVEIAVVPPGNTITNLCTYIIIHFQSIVEKVVHFTKATHIHTRQVGLHTSYTIHNRHMMYCTRTHEYDVS